MKQSLYLWMVVVLSLCLGFLMGTNQQLLRQMTQRPLEGQAKLQQFFHYLDQYYVDDIDTDSLATTLIERLIADLDPHSFYISPAAYARLEEDMQGSFMGIGVSFFMVNDTVNVVRVLPGGPSEKAGIQPGDRILQVDQDTLYGKELSSEAIIQRLKGQTPIDLDLKIYRPVEQKQFAFKLKRGTVPLPTVNHYLLNANVGYLKIIRFGKNTVDEFEKALNQLQAQGMRQLILDLRDNPGGYLEAAIAVADAFLSEGQAIVSIESNKGERETTHATREGGFLHPPVYVLINRASASASEVVAGALQDNDRAWILGQRSFGKGLVQQQMPLGQNEAVRLTTARYYTPTGRSIQRPYLESKSDYFAEVQQRYSTGELAAEDQIPIVDSLAYTTPKGRTVYGGGGIVPDIYITENTDMDAAWEQYLLDSNLVNHFVYLTLDTKRKQYKDLTPEQWVGSALENPAFWLEAFDGYLQQQGAPLMTYDKAMALSRIRAYLALQLFGETQQQQVLHQSDKFILRALEHMKDATQTKP